MGRIRKEILVETKVNSSRVYRSSSEAESFDHRERTTDSTFRWIVDDMTRDEQTSCKNEP